VGKVGSLFIHLRDISYGEGHWDLLLPAINILMMTSIFDGWIVEMYYRVPRSKSNSQSQPHYDWGYPQDRSA